MRSSLLTALLAFFRRLFYCRCIVCSQTSEGQEICAACALRIAQTPWGVSGLSVDDCRIGVLWREAYGGPLTSAIYRAKFSGHWSGAQTLGQCLAQAPFLWTGPKPTLVPIALAASRLAGRGYNQAAMISAGLGRAWGLDVKTRWLFKVRSTPRQLKLGKAFRERNLAKSFVAHRAVRGQRIVLVDDVMTTGATLREASRAICAAGGTVIGAAVVARSDGQARQMGDNRSRHDRLKCRPRRA